jgi:hypothetical protein
VPRRIAALTRGNSANALATRTFSRAAPMAKPVRQFSQWAHEVKPSPHPPRSSNWWIMANSS